MLRRASELRVLKLQLEDGEIGGVEEFLFDADRWTIRYLVANTGTFLAHRQVLISPVALGHADWNAKTLNVHLTREQVDNSPTVEAGQPVSREWETEYYNYYGWPYYWGGSGLWGGGLYPSALSMRSANGAVRQNSPDMLPGSAARIPHLDGATRPHEVPGAPMHSTKEVTGYHIHATDGDLGHVYDFIVDDDSWTIEYMAVDPSNWWPGKKVLLPPRWIDSVSWEDKMVTVNLNRDQVRNGPEWMPDEPITRLFEGQLYKYYGKDCYWESNPPVNEPVGAHR